MPNSHVTEAMIVEALCADPSASSLEISRRLGLKGSNRIGRIRRQYGIAPFKVGRFSSATEEEILELLRAGVPTRKVGLQLHTSPARVARIRDEHGIAPVNPRQNRLTWGKGERTERTAPKLELGPEDLGHSCDYCWEGRHFRCHDKTCVCSVCRRPVNQEDRQRALALQ